MQLLRVASLFDALGLNSSHKIQVPLAPPGNDAAFIRFDDRYRRLPDAVQQRLVIETAAARLALRDSLKLWSAVGVPVVYRSDTSTPEAVAAALRRSRITWSVEDGAPLYGGLRG